MKSWNKYFRFVYILIYSTYISNLKLDSFKYYDLWNHIEVGLLKNFICGFLQTMPILSNIIKDKSMIKSLHRSGDK